MWVQVDLTYIWVRTDLISESKSTSYMKLSQLKLVSESAQTRIWVRSDTYLSPLRYEFESTHIRIWVNSDSREHRVITRSVSHYSVFRPKSELVGKVIRRIVNLPLSNWINLTLAWDNRVVLWYTSLVCWQSFNLRKRLWLLVLRHLPECNCALWVNLTLRLRPI